MSDITIRRDEYDALVALAQRGTHDADGGINAERTFALKGFLDAIEKRNGISRRSLWILWQDPKAPLPPGTRFPKTWPPEQKFLLQLTSRDITKQDVLDTIAQRTTTPVGILVTEDPAGDVGWTKLEEQFPNG